MIEIEIIHNLVDYFKSIELMNNYSLNRKEKIWILEHNPVYTINKKTLQNQQIEEKINNIKVFDTDRGGSWTFHGKGQIICYFSIDIKRFFKKDINILIIINFIEEIIIKFLNYFNLIGIRKNYNHGIWVQSLDNIEKKIAFIGLKIKNKMLIHGFSININCDLKNFDFIKPCNLNDRITSIEFEKNNKINIKESKIILKDIIISELRNIDFHSF